MPYPTKTRRPSFYYEYIRSIRWKQVRSDYMRRSGWTCERCFVRKANIVHHLGYERLGHEPPEDLMALCAECHAKLHTWPPLRADNDNKQLKFAFEEAANDNQPKLPFRNTG